MSRSCLHCAFSAHLAAFDVVADATDKGLFVRSCLLSAETRWPRRATFLDLEIPDYEIERRNANSRALFRRAYAKQLPDDEAGQLWRPSAGPVRANSARKRTG